MCPAGTARSSGGNGSIAAVPTVGFGVQVSWENEGGLGQGGAKHWPIAHLNGGIPGANSKAWVPLDGERMERFSRGPAGKIWLWETSFRTYCLSEAVTADEYSANSVNKDLNQKTNRALTIL